MKRKRIGEEKSRPIGSFIIKILVNYSVSGTESQRQWLEKYCDEHNGQDISQFFKEKYYEKMGVSGATEYNDLEIVDKVKKISREDSFERMKISRKKRFSSELTEDIPCKKE